MIRVAEEPWREMVAHARSTYPNECVGAMLGSMDGDQKEVLIAMRLENSTAGSQRARYELRPEDLLAADKEARRQ
jgi:proteasome lid subunit RPN8/RPN11